MFRIYAGTLSTILKVAFVNKKRKKERKKTHHKKHFQRRKRFWTLNRGKGKKRTAVMNYEQCWSSSSSEVCRERVEYKTHPRTLSVCWPSSCRPICPRDLRPRFGSSCGWNSPRMTAQLEDNGGQNNSQVSGRTSNLLHSQADVQHLLLDGPPLTSVMYYLRYLLYHIIGCS